MFDFPRLTTIVPKAAKEKVVTYVRYQPKNIIYYCIDFDSVYS